ncbi:hypothetical protein [Pseudodesulfovibrio tunisiensis]|uniref:hypothetical protein n=1 Tax=Pseudodesulfovibrio tunisiensis TaxID=463192 RepID=UPI001FB37B14|nr:hypothetical protein [Pseudodesulfovibrio tunisiensis]
MGQYAAFTSDSTLEEQVKSLADEELLDFWEETQQLARMANQDDNPDAEYCPEYERIILQELQFRTCCRGNI